MGERTNRIIRNLRAAVAKPGWRRSKSIRWAIGIGLTLIVAVLFPSAHTMALSGYSAGSLWTGEDVNAPFSFPVYKDMPRYRSDVRKALESLYPVYLPDTSARETSLATLRSQWDRMTKLLTLARQDSLDDQLLLDSAKQLALTKEEWSALTAFAHDNKSQKQIEKSNAQLDEIEMFLGKSIGDLESSALITLATNEEAAASNAHFFSLRFHANEESVLLRDSLMPLAGAVNRIYGKLDERLKSDRAKFGAGDASLLHPLARIVGNAVRPTVKFDPQLTEESRTAIIDRVPRTDGIVAEGQRIIAKGEIITPAMKSSLESLSQARLDRGGVVAELARITGTIGHAGLIILLLVLYLKFIRRRIYKDNGQLLLMALVILFPAVLAYFSVRVQVDFPLQYFILIPVASMLLTVLFDSRTGFYGTVIVALIVAGIRGNDYSIALAGLCAGAFAAYTVRDLRNRAQLFTSIAYVFIGYLISITALSLEAATPLKEVGFALLAALGNSLISPVITLGVLFAIENVFDTVSDLRLSEFDNINHPLLRELALRAPGTYQHTMLVAQLTENAAIAIGANALLAKIGAYFHDVGKLAEPTVFVENQGGENANVHEALTPLESAERIRAHVTQGIELARAHNLPGRVIDFIPMHHGTLPISFFYQRAVMESASGPDTINEQDFHYPGPSPNTKETAILMLADAAEAIARSLAATGQDMTPEAIDASIEQLIRTRFDQKQLDHCDITVRDLMVIRGVFSHLLSGLYHARIQYPTTVVMQTIAPPALAAT